MTDTLVGDDGDVFGDDERAVCVIHGDEHDDIDHRTLSLVVMVAFG